MLQVRLRAPPHGWAPGWLATHSLYDSFIRNSMLVCPGAIPSFALMRQLAHYGVPANFDYGHDPW